MVDLALPMPSIPAPSTKEVDQTKTANVPGIASATTSPGVVNQIAEKQAMGAEKFAYSPNQGAQVKDTQVAARSELDKRAMRVAKNQQTQQTLAEIETTKQKIAEEVAAIGVLNGQISTLKSEIAQIESSISSTQSSINGVRGQISSVQAQAAAAPTYNQPASSIPQASVPIPQSNLAAEAETRRVQEAEIQRAREMKNSQKYQQLKVYHDTVGQKKTWAAENEANATLTRMGSANMTPTAIAAVRADIDRKYGAGQFDPQYMEYYNMSMEINRLGRSEVRSS